MRGRIANVYTSERNAMDAPVSARVPKSQGGWQARETVTAPRVDQPMHQLAASHALNVGM